MGLGFVQWAPPVCVVGVPAVVVVTVCDDFFCYWRATGRDSVEELLADVVRRLPIGTVGGMTTSFCRCCRSVPDGVG